MAQPVKVLVSVRFGRKVLVFSLPLLQLVVYSNY